VSLVLGCSFLSAIQLEAASDPSQLSRVIKGPAEWVNPLIDTVKSRWIFFSSACRPFGMVNLSPDTNPKGDWHAGYIYTTPTISCFSHIHAWQLAGLPVMPVTGDVNGQVGMDGYKSDFSHEDEVVHPGYHKVVLKRYGITVELTSTERVGFHRYHFPPGEKERVIIDTAFTLMECNMIASEGQPTADGAGVDGSFTMSPTIRRPKPLTVYYAIRFNRPFTTFGGWKDKNLLPANPAKVSGPKAGMFVDFAPSADPLLMKVAISYTSQEGALRNLAAELPAWDFDSIVRQSTEAWNNTLGRIEVGGGTDAEKVKFYTDLWHALLGRRIISDVDFKYPDNTGPTARIREVTPSADGTRFPHYNFDALWGAQWSLDILWPLAWPEIMDGFCQTMVDMYRDGGMIPRGPTGGNYSFVMIGDTATPLFAAAYSQGIRSWDVKKAYEGLRKNAFPGGIRDHAGYEFGTNATGGGISYYIDRGYVPEGIPGKGMHRDGASMTIEYAYEDWCLSQLATALGKKEDAALFLTRSQSYRNLWNKDVGWLCPRTLDGGWLPGFNPTGKGRAAEGFTEANSAIYTYFTPHDPQGLFGLFGGNAKFIERLNEQFLKAQPSNFTMRKAKECWLDYGNEPSFEMAGWFNLAGAPWLSQQWTRKVHEAALSDITPFGGYAWDDEDQGMMGSLSALMAMGLFSMDGCAAINPSYEITAPLFDRIVIHLNPKYAKGKTFEIITRNNSPANSFIQSARLNGKPWNSFQLPHDAVLNGGVLELDLGPHPNKSWGIAHAQGL